MARDKQLIAAETRAEVEKLLGVLKPREAEILRLRFGFDGQGERTLEEIGGVFGVSRERIRQIESVAMRKLQHPCRADWVGTLR